MQIVTTPSEARAAITGNPPKLAVVLSLEMDYLSLSDIQKLVKHFHVAHVIPVHLADNSFGGTAIYSDLFNGLSNFLNGSPENSVPDNNVNFNLGTRAAHIEPVTLDTLLNLSSGQVAVLDIALAGAALLGPEPAAAVAFWALALQFGVDLMPTGALGYQPVIPAAGPTRTPGEVNSKDLNQEEFSVLMSMGLLLDIAHMGQKTAGRALAMAQKDDYPLMDSHTGIRCDYAQLIDCFTPFGAPPNPILSPGTVVNERSLPTSQLDIIRQLGGVVGQGVVPAVSGNTVDPDPVTTWIKNYSITLDFMHGRGVALGTDAHGLSPMIQRDTTPTGYPINVASIFGCPAACPVLPKYVFGGFHQLDTGGGRSYDFEHDGIANYGLLPDFIQAATLPRPEPVLCNVFDDGYTNIAGPSDAVYIHVGSGVGTSMPACIPSNSSTGICHKWFGRCFTSQTNVPVYFHVFDDDYQNDGGSSDAVYVPQPANACIPANNSTGTCRKWFGRGITQDGRNVTCDVFDDGYSNLQGPTDAIYSLGILGQQNLDACMPDGTSTGLCRKWFGRCFAFTVPIVTPTPQITALFGSAEDTIEMWERVQIAAKAVQTPEPVLCNVFDDGYTNIAGTSDTVYIHVGSGVGTSMPVCIPSNSSTGICHKWFGRCFTSQTNVPVYFHVFDDDYQNDGGSSDAVYVPQPANACIPANNSTGTCRKWFGRGITQDGRNVTCDVFDDGYSNLQGPTDAIYSLGILGQQNLDACIPDGTTTGLCRKWFGRCNAFAGQ